MNRNMSKKQVNSKNLSKFKEEVRQLFECIEMAQKGKASIDLIRSKLAVINKGVEINPRINNIKKNKNEVKNIPINILINDCKNANKKNLSKPKRAVDKLSVCIDYVEMGYAGANMNWIISGLEFINEGMAVISRINADLESYKAIMAEGENS